MVSAIFPLIFSYYIF